MAPSSRPTSAAAPPSALPAPAPDPGLTEAQQATVERLTAALSACDWDTLATTVDDRFTASFGGDDALTLWEDGERYDEAPLRTLHTLFTPQAGPGRRTGWPSGPGPPPRSGPPSTGRPGVSCAPSAWARTTSPSTPSSAPTSATGTGIGADGTWQFYVVGD